MKCESFRNAKSSRYHLIQKGQICDALHRTTLSSKLSIDGAIYQDSGELIRESVRLSGGSSGKVYSLQPDSIQTWETPNHTLSGKTLFLGNFMSHYGHFLTEGLSRMWLTHMEDFDNFVFFPFIFGNLRKNIKEYHFLFGSALGVDFNRIKIIREPTRFEEIWVPEQLWEIGSNPKPELKKVYKKIASSFSDTEEGGRYFLSRSPSLSQRVTSVSEVEDIFRHLDFDIIYPELLSMSEQMAIYKGADVIVSFSGSAMHNVLFSKKGSAWFWVEDSNTPENFPATQSGANSISQGSTKKIPYSGKSDTESIQELKREVERALSHVS